MHDPMTQAFRIPYPWRAYSRSNARNDFERHYRHPFITIWHVDPERDGSDDSCGWFMRERHGDPKVLERIRRLFAEDWDRVFVSGESGRMYPVGLFYPDGKPRFSVHGIVLNLFFLAALEALGGSHNAARFMQRNLWEILWFAEKPIDSLHASLTHTFGVNEHETKAERIEHFAGIIYGWILRKSRPWYRHPRWHVWHWSLQVHPWQHFRRWALNRCQVCGKGFRYGESPVSDSYWYSRKPKFLRGEQGLRHSDCGGAHP